MWRFQESRPSCAFTPVMRSSISGPRISASRSSDSCVRDANANAVSWRRRCVELINAGKFRSARGGLPEGIGQDGDQIGNAKRLLDGSGAGLSQLLGDRRGRQFSAHEQEEGLALAAARQVRDRRVKTET